MRRRRWLRFYIMLLIPVLALAIVGIAQSCPVFKNGYLSGGCLDHMTSTSVWTNLLIWALVSGAVAFVGTTLALVSHRRPMFISFLVRGSAGLLEVAMIGSWYISPSYLAPPLLGLSAFAVATAIPTGVSASHPSQKAGQPSKANVLTATS